MVTESGLEMGSWVGTTSCSVLAAGVGSGIQPETQEVCMDLGVDLELQHQLVELAGQEQMIVLAESYSASRN